MKIIDKRIKRYKRKISFFLINHFLCGTRQIFFPVKRHLLNWAGVEVGKNTRIVGPLFVSCDLIIGCNVWLGRNFSADGNGRVIIGNDCDVAPNVQFYTGTHQIGSKERRAGNGYNGEIIIGNGCWLCAASKFMPDISIGDAVVVAAGSVVVQNVDNDLLVGGVPARPIRKL